MSNILIIEPDPLRAETVAVHIHAHLEVSSRIAESVESAQKNASDRCRPPVAVILSHWASPEDYAPLAGIPTIVVTDGVPVSAKQIAAFPNVIDYVPDTGGYHLDYILQLIRRVLWAGNFKILLADPEKVNRILMRRLLSQKGHFVTEARNEKEVRRDLQQYPDIRMLIIDGQMCADQNFSLIRTIRNDFKKDRLSVLTLCERNTEYQRLMLLRHGASDCIEKPIRIEEFQVRFMLNLELMETFIELTRSARGAKK
ncbi:CheY-like chemotaxis protein [Desulfosalsimonas propionicica]|uniref:CheY-like chemotaxis protein n=1 Tax=Desulfosalsimonas propionicica TaxID=332175 RepID=A0A7W0C7J9_9BACT|nr:CheY-like chemotaxis protein [Desulfosalsimonas propionicica]